MDRRKHTEGKPEELVLLLLSAGFLAGGILGCCLVCARPNAAWVASFLQGVQQGTISQPGLFRTLWTTLRWPAAALLLGLLPLRRLTIPVLFFVRGFLLSCGIASFISQAGKAGLACAGLVFGPECILSVPALFLIGMLSLGPRNKKNRILAPVLLCTLPLIACIALERNLVPLALNRFLSVFLTAGGTSS